MISARMKMAAGAIAYDTIRDDQAKQDAQNYAYLRKST
jgi:hypothetical protein